MAEWIQFYCDICSMVYLRRLHEGNDCPVCETEGKCVNGESESNDEIQDH